jgi:hypothetical protein
MHAILRQSPQRKIRERCRNYLTGFEIAAISSGVGQGILQAFGGSYRDAKFAEMLDAGVPEGGIEPSTHGFSVGTPEFHNLLKFSMLLTWFTILIPAYGWISLVLGNI